MKKLIGFATVMLALVSCTKDYTCECTESYTEYENGVVVETETKKPYTTIYKDVTKEVAERNCTSMTYSYIDNDGSDVYKDSYKYDCKLSK